MNAAMLHKSAAQGGMEGRYCCTADQVASIASSVSVQRCYLAFCVRACVCVLFAVFVCASSVVYVCVMYLCVCVCV